MHPKVDPDDYDECDHIWNYVEEFKEWECELCGAACHEDTFPVGDYVNSCCDEDAVIEEEKNEDS